jgi:hypothetical protein
MMIPQRIVPAGLLLYNDTKQDGHSRIMQMLA